VNNPIGATNIAFIFDPIPGTTLFQNLAPTTRRSQPEPLGISRFFSTASILISMPASFICGRFYDPFSGLFLQPDPAEA
jgi:hypothetical protein